MKYLSITFEDPASMKSIKVVPPEGVPTGGLSDFSKYAGNGILLLFIGATLLALFFLIWGGLSWILSGGDKTKVQAARNRIVYAIIGLIICFLAFAIVSIIGTLFRVDLLSMPKI